MKDYEELIKKIEEDIKIVLSTPSEIHKNYIKDEIEVSQIIGRVNEYAFRIMLDDPKNGGGEILALSTKSRTLPWKSGNDTGRRWGHYEMAPNMVVEK